MANKFQNGLLLSTSISGRGGHLFSRWLVEWLTQVVGWTLRDEDPTDSSWTDVEASGSGDGATTANADQVDMSGSSKTDWDSDDRGKYVTITGITGTDAEVEKNGIYRILDVLAGNVLVLDIKRGVHEDGLPNGKSFSWRLWDGTAPYIPDPSKFAVVRAAYSHTPSEPNLDIRLLTTATGGAYSGFPSIAIGPFGTWDNGTHDWDDDRNTSQKNPVTTGASTIVDTYVWAFGTDDHAVICYWNHTNNIPNFIYLGELAVDDTSVDTNPGVFVYGGAGSATSTVWPNMMGYGNGGQLEDAGRGMSALPDDDTEVTYYLQVPSIAADVNEHVLGSGSQRVSSWSRYLYRIEIELECRTSGHMEHRGELKNCWMTSKANQNLMSFGDGPAPDFYLHLFGGFAVTWNGSSIHVQK